MERTGYWVIKTYEAGRVGEKCKIFVPGEKLTKSERRIKSDLRKQKDNDTNRTRHVARLINANFHPGDCFCALTVSDEGLEQLKRDIPAGLDEAAIRQALYEACTKEARRFLKRCRECKNKNLQWGKFFLIVSDMDGETGEAVRVHCHIIAPANALEMIKAKWKLGMVRENKVWNEPDHYGLAKYLMDQVRRIPDAKKYISSRALIIPKPKYRPAPTAKEVQPPRGAKVLYRREYIAGQPQYIRYLLPEAKAKGSGGYKDETSIPN